LLLRGERAHVFDRDGEAARRGKTFERRLAVDEVARREAFDEILREGVGEPRQRFGRQFLGQ